MSQHDIEALLFAVFVALVFGAGFGTAIWLDLSRQIDEATRLPEHPRPQRPAIPSPRTEPPTARVNNATVHNLPRRGSLIDRSL